MKKVLIIDNYDSFTYILKQYFGELEANPEVFLNDQITVEEISKMNPTHIVLSPGPGTVEDSKDAGVMFEVIENFYKKIPILGVCLGHQAIGKHFGMEITRAPKMMHGKRSIIEHDGQGLFAGLKHPLEVMRYHSLALKFPISNFQFLNKSQTQNPKSHIPIEVTAKSEDKVIMAIQHKEYPVFGVQFHPESLGTEGGKKLLSNFLNFQFPMTNSQLK